MDTKLLRKPWLLIPLLMVAGLTLAGIFFASSHPTPTSENSLKPENPPAAGELKMFKSPDLGFSFKYPTDWPNPEVLRLTTGIEINLNNILSISTSSNFPTNLSFQDYMIAEYEGKIAFTKKADGTIEITIVFPHPYLADQFLIITYIEEKEIVDVIEEILSTLEFTDSPAVTITSAIENLPEPTVNPTKSSSSIPTKSGFVPTTTSPLLPTPTLFSLPTPDPATFDAREEECIYGCIPEDKFQ